MYNLPELTPRQSRAIAALLAEDTVLAAAESVGVNARTLFRWLEQRPFRQALNKARREALSLANIRLQRLVDQAPRILEGIVHDPKASPATRVRAVIAATKIAQQGIEIDEFEDRLADLEEAREAIEKAQSSQS